MILRDRKRTLLTRAILAPYSQTAFPHPPPRLLHSSLQKQRYSVPYRLNRSPRLHAAGNEAAGGV